MRSLITLKMLTYRADRRHRRGADDLIAGVDRRGAQLGLPLLLAARRDAGAVRADRPPAIATRRAPGANGCCAPPPGILPKCRSCTGIAGERRLTEFEIDWLPGYAEQPAGAHRQCRHEQLQLDVYGELMDTLYACHRYGLEASADAWDLQLKLLEFLEKVWDKPDQGMWEVRGEPRHFTFSKIMAWVAFDRAVKSIEQYGYKGPREHWQRAARTIAEQIIEKGVRSRSATPLSSITARRISTPRYC